MLAWLADTCFASRTTAPPGSTPEDVIRREGMRSVFLAITDLLEMSDRDIRDMQNEVAER